MKILLAGLVFLTSVSARNCSKSKSDIPPCIQARIEEIKKEPRWNPPAEIYEYEYQGKRVFYFNSNCCDNFNPLVDEDCNYLCAPSGGYTGKGDRKCEDFNATAKKIRLVWKDDR